MRWRDADPLHPSNGVAWRIPAADPQFARLRVVYSCIARPETTYGGQLLPGRVPQVVQEFRAGCPPVAKNRLRARVQATYRRRLSKWGQIRVASPTRWRVADRMLGSTESQVRPKKPLLLRHAPQALAQDAGTPRAASRQGPQLGDPAHVMTLRSSQAGLPDWRGHRHRRE